MKSDVVDQTNRPPMLNIDSSPTNPAAAVTATADFPSALRKKSWIIGLACSRMPIPAVTLQNSTTHSSQNWWVRTASDAETWAVVTSGLDSTWAGSNPPGCQPGGGARQYGEVRVVPRQQLARQRRGDQRAAAEAHDGHAGGHPRPVGEPLDQRGHRRDVADTQPDAADEAVAEVDQPQLLGGDGEDEADRGEARVEMLDQSDLVHAGGVCLTNAQMDRQRGGWDQPSAVARLGYRVFAVEEGKCSHYAPPSACWACELARALVRGCSECSPVRALDSTRTGGLSWCIAWSGMVDGSGAGRAGRSGPHTLTSTPRARCRSGRPVPASAPPCTMRYSSRIGRLAKKHSRISRVPAAYRAWAD